MPTRTITLTSTPVSGRAGHCATGCGARATEMTTASVDGVRACTFACVAHRPEAEVKALRMLADAFERLTAERRGCRRVA